MPLPEPWELTGWPEDPAHLPVAGPGGLAELLQACVAQGASIGWTATPSAQAAQAFWRGCAASARQGERSGWLLQRGEQVLGTVQAVWAGPENGARRAEIVKLMVHPAARRQGLAERLMGAAEAEAVRRGKRLLLLDTRVGDHGERLYHRLGFQTVGCIPRYAIDVDGTMCATRVMFKALGAQGLQVRPASPEAPQARQLLDELSALLLAAHGSDGRHGLAGYTPERSAFALALDGQGQALGCGALRPLALQEVAASSGPAVAELKRLYAREPGRGTGQALMAWLTQQAWVLGYRELRLSTRRANTRALRFYQAQGFTECAPWPAYAQRPETICLARRLAD